MRFTLVVVVLLLFSCEIEHVSSVPAEVLPYVTAFFEEAQLHGRNIILEDADINIVFAKLLEAEGQCALPGGTIRIDSVYWRIASESQREWLIYHELGHCVLGRTHRSDAFVRGECRSIMRGGIDETNCSMNLISGSWRAYYMDELFELSTPDPDWYKSIPLIEFSKLNEQVSIDTIISDERYSITMEESFFEGNHQFCITFDAWDSIESCVFLSWDSRKLMLCSNGKIELRHDYNIGLRYYSETYFESSRDHEVLSQSTLCIMRYGNMNYAYVDGELYHVFDYVPVVDHRIYTNSIDSSMHITFTSGIE